MVNLVVHTLLLNWWIHIRRNGKYVGVLSSVFKLTLDCETSLVSIDFWHIQVHEYKVKVSFEWLLDGFLAVKCLFNLVLRYSNRFGDYLMQHHLLHRIIVHYQNTEAFEWMPWWQCLLFFDFICQFSLRWVTHGVDDIFKTEVHLISYYSWARRLLVWIL